MTRRAVARHWLTWVVITAGVTALLLALRGDLEKTHVALAYLLLVLAGSASAGHRAGLVLSVVSFLLFDWCFIPPYNTLAIANPLDWFVLAAYLVVSVVAAQLLYRLQIEAESARQRATEVDRVAALGAETLNVARATDALAAVSEVLRATLRIDRCRIHTAEAVSRLPRHDDLVQWVMENGLPALRRPDGTVHLLDSADLAMAPLAAAQQAFLPLRVRGHPVGVLELDAPGTLGFDGAERRFLIALAYYAALAVERARLESEADHAVALREADRMKNALLASVSHDLRTPLTTIKALAHDLGPTDERAAIIEQEADRLNRLVADLLDLSRVQGGVLADPVLNAVDDLVAAVIQRVTGLLGRRELRVAMADGGTLLIGRFDLPAAVRILVNLIENAAKYAPADLPIELTARSAGDMIELAVADRGPGVGAAERDRIFEPFYRPAGATPDGGGAGLGLAIARGLAEAQHGALRYTPRPGGGAVFTLTLPAADLPALTLQL